MQHVNIIDKAIKTGVFFILSLQLFTKYVNFASVVNLQAHTAYMWDVESRRSQVKIPTNEHINTWSVEILFFLHLQ